MRRSVTGSKGGPGQAAPPGKRTAAASGRVKGTAGKKKTSAGAANAVRSASGSKRSKSAAVRVRLNVDDRRAQLLALGCDAFARRSYEAVSIEEIAAQAGISRGLLFHYFPSKRDFYVAVIDVMARQMLEETFVAEPAGQGPVELLQLLVQGLDNYFAYVENRASTFATLLRAGGEAGAAEVVEFTRKEFVRRMRAYLPVMPDVDEAMLRASLTAWERFVEGIAVDWIEYRDLSRTDRVQLAVRAAFMFPGPLVIASPS